MNGEIQLNETTAYSPKDYTLIFLLKGCDIMSNNSNKAIKSKVNKSFNEHYNQSYNENSFNTTTINNYFNSHDYYKEQVTKYNSVDRIGIYDRVGEIITCEVIFTWQEKIVGKEKIPVHVVINVIEKGILIADHIHVDVSEYKDFVDSSLKCRAQITGVVYAYDKDNEKRGIKLIEPPLWLSDKLKTNQEPEYYPFYSQDKCNMKLNSYDKKELVNLIQFYKIKLNNLTESSLGRDTVFNYTLTQITLNRNNNFIYENKLEKFSKPILYYIVLLLSAIIYDLTTLMDNKKYFVKLGGDGFDCAEISIFNLFADICLYCNYLQGINGFKNNTHKSPGYMFICKELNINPGKAYSHTVKHRYTNFNLGDLEVNIFNDSRPFSVIGKSIL